MQGESGREMFWGQGRTREGIHGGGQLSSRSHGFDLAVVPDSSLSLQAAPGISTPLPEMA